MLVKKFLYLLFIFVAASLSGQDTHSFEVDAMGNAQLILMYPTHIKTLGSDGVETFKKEKFRVNLGNLTVFPLSPQQVAQKIKDALVKKFKLMSDRDLVSHAGSSTFGRDVSKWSITLGGQPFESFSKTTALATDVNKMKELYSKGLEAKYDEVANLPSAPMQSSLPAASLGGSQQAMLPAITAPQPSLQPPIPASPAQGVPASPSTPPSYSSPQG